MIKEFNCPQCNLTFYSSKKRIYCSKSCSSIAVNIRRHRIVKPKINCSICNEPVAKNNKTDLHRECRYKRDVLVYGLNSLKDTSYEKGQFRFVKVRQHAQRLVDIYNIERKCVVCDYNKYVELCHIKEISSFNLTDTLYIVNSLKNLCYLCPNHHKELDNKLMSNDDMNKILSRVLPTLWEHSELQTT